MFVLWSRRSVTAVRGVLELRARHRGLVGACPGVVSGKAMEDFDVSGVVGLARVLEGAYGCTLAPGR